MISQNAARPYFTKCLLVTKILANVTKLHTTRTRIEARLGECAPQLVRKHCWCVYWNESKYFLL